MPYMRFAPLTALAVMALGMTHCASSSAPTHRVAAPTPPSPPEHHHEAPPPQPRPVAQATVAVSDQEQPNDPLAAERAAYDRARPVFERHCAACHTSEGEMATRGSLRHFVMDDYPFGGHHAHDIAAEIRRVLGATGRRPTMPRGDAGSVQGDDLAAILAWADAFDRAHSGSSLSPR